MQVKERLGQALRSGWDGSSSATGIELAHSIALRHIELLLVAHARKSKRSIRPIRDGTC